MSVRHHLEAFARDVREDRKSKPPTPGDGPALELLLAPRFQALIEAILAEHLPLAPRVLPEWRRPGIGRPDLAFAHPGQPARAFIELKVPANPLDPGRLRGHDKAQFRRFGALPLWGWCNFHRIQLYARDQLAAEATILPAACLEETTDEKRAAAMLAGHDASAFVAILERLAAAEPPRLPDASAVALHLAYGARLVRGIVLDAVKAGPPPALRAVRAEFEQTLFAHPEAAGHDNRAADTLFAGAFAQTLAFGLLLARAATGEEVSRNAYQHLPPGSLPRATLRALTQDENLEVLGAGFDLLRDTVNATDPAALTEAGGRDPILYFYEEFLATFDPKAREQYGVFYTPPDLVAFIVSRTDAALRDGLGTEGLRDGGVQLLDPACGTGTFAVGALKEVAEQTAAYPGPGAVPAAVSGLAARLGGFELLVGPYTIAHWRVGREVAARGGHVPGRLPIWLADTLAPAGGTPSAPVALGFMAQPLVAERAGADALKLQAPILAILGNPPYRRLRKGEIPALVGPWMDALWADLKDPVRQAGAGRSLNAFPDLYVAFWRWALWRLFEAEGATRRGVVSFVTNRGFLAGRAFGGLRRMLRDRFDTIEVLDLRGDHRGARPAHLDADDNVFNIQTGVCVVTAWATGAKPLGQPARLLYADVWDHGAFRRAGKLELLREAAAGRRAISWREVPGRGMADLKWPGFAGRGWPALDEVFRFRSNGVVTYRDGFSYASRRDALARRIRGFLAMPPAEARKAFKDTRDRSFDRAQAIPFDEAALREVIYRPMDRRWLYNRREYVDFPKPALQVAFQAPNLALFALEDGTGRGPAAWCHALLPDQHAFNGRGGWVFPLRDPAGGVGAHHLEPRVLAGLALAHGAAPSPLAVLDAALALLSAPSYARRFSRDLEDSFPHLPFPADPGAFAAAAALGAEIRAVQTFARPPGALFRTARVEGTTTRLTLAVPGRERAWTPDGAGTGAVALSPDGTLRLTGVPEAAWRFEVSGYPVLFGWLKGREDDPLDAAFLTEAAEQVARIAELLSLFSAADGILETALAAPLTRAELGLPEPVPFGEGGVPGGEDEDAG